MTPSGLLLLADEGLLHTKFEWGRIQSNSDWIPPILALLAVSLFVRFLYRRDSVELPRALGWFLTALRVLAFVGLLLYYLQPGWRTEREVVRNSRVAIMVDTSLSMGLTDSETSSHGGLSRLQQVAATLQETDLLQTLSKTHDMNVYQFSTALEHDRVVSLAKGSVRDAAHREPPAEGAKPDEKPAQQPPDWRKLLRPSGAETRFGESLEQAFREEQGKSLAGIIVFTDGGQNAGDGPEATAEAAGLAGVPIFPVGVGSTRRPVRVRVSDLVVPARAYPKDRYTVTGYVQAQRLAGQVVTVQLLSREAESGDTAKRGTGQLEGTQRVTLGTDGEPVPVTFQLTPSDKIGRRTLCFRVLPPPSQRDQTDTYREADIDIAAQRTNVLLFAGGPMREYQFLRTLLYRDSTMKVDVLLQSGQPGISQEAHDILTDFPKSAEAMYAYDCVVAFDPNWQALSANQIDLLESWVGSQGGGLIVVAGPVFAGKGVGGWTDGDATTKIRNLYPVEFPQRFSTEGASYIGNEPWPLEFTREGKDADFLWLGESPRDGARAWANFPGVYSFTPVRGPKPAAAVLARFTDPRMAINGKAPPYFVEQFYGSGRVFYMGSGEMWRLRPVDPSHFDQFYTKLVRHVAQSRLLRGSKRGTLMVGQDRYLLGNTAEVRAQLTNVQYKPLAAGSVPLDVIAPDGKVATVPLRADPDKNHPGVFLGRFPVLLEGEYRLELPVPESEKERIVRRLQVKVPERESENPQRNDPLLKLVAQKSKGEYYPGLAEALDLSRPRPLLKAFEDRTTMELVPVAPNKLWEKNWLRWLLISLCGLLCLEWLIRRLMKLA